MKNSVTILSSIAIIPLFCGCALFQKQPAEVQLAKYQSIIASATQIGATIDLRKNPGHRAAYEVTLQAIESLRVSGNYDPVKLMDALKKLPIKEFSGTSGAWQLTPQDVVMAWDAISSFFIVPDKTPPWVKASLDGISIGLNKALEATPTKQLKTSKKVTISMPSQ